MKRILTLLSIACFFVGTSQPIPQTKKVTEKFFPEMEIDISTPAFQKKKGFTNYEELMAFISQKVMDHPNLISYVFIGESQKGRKIPMLTLTNKASNAQKLNVWMQGGLHGNEPASTEGLLYLIDRLLEDPANAYLLNEIVLNIVPMANIDGYIKQDRYAANGLDLNRDQTKLMAQESVSLKQAFSDFNAHVAVDFHEYRPYRRDFAKMGDNGITSPYDVMFLYSGNLNVPEELRNFTKNAFVVPTKKELDKVPLTYNDYITTRDVHGDIHFNQGSISPRSSATNYALTNCVSSLIEVRGVALGRTSFKRRVFTTYSVGKSYLELAVKNADAVRNTIEGIQNNGANDAVVKSKRGIFTKELAFIDLTLNEKVPMEFIVHDAWHSEATLERPRPTSYVILPDQKAIFEKLKTLGLNYRTIEKDQEIEVEKFVITKYRRDPYLYEGVHMQHVAARTEATTVSFPKGTAIVALDQKKGNLLIELMEPEASSSFVSFEVIKTELNAELPVYRYVSKGKL